MGSTRNYAHAPLVLALVEVRHPPLPVPTVSQIAVVKDALRDVLPIPAEEAVHTFAVAPNGDGKFNPQVTTQQIRRLRSRDMRTTMTLTGQSLAVETTDYPGWGTFRVLLERALEQRAALGAPDGVTRIGLRYVNEVRLPDATGSPPNWGDWLDRQVAPLQPAGMAVSVAQQQSTVLFNTDRLGDKLTLRYGAVNGPPAVSGAARPDAPGPGLYFLLDTDAAWEQTGEVPEFDQQMILATLDRLHGDVSDLFESVLTDKIREEVFDGD